MNKCTAGNGHLQRVDPLQIRDDILMLRDHVRLKPVNRLKRENYHEIRAGELYAGRPSDARVKWGLG